MRRIAGSDASFLYLEAPGRANNNGWLIVLRDRDGAGPLTLDALEAHVARRLPFLPTLRWRVVPVPGQLHHPMAVEDPRFELRRHLHRMELAAPGDEDELCRVAAHLHREILDRRRPLWRLTLIDGLADGRQGLFVQVHHMLMDAAALRANLDILLRDLDPAAELAGDPWRPEPLPTRRRLLADAARDWAVATAHAPPAFLRWAQGVRAQRAFLRSSDQTLPRLLVDSPSTSLNLARAQGRVLHRVLIPGEHIRAIRAASGVTVNDVGLAVVGGALRRYLAERGELPDRSLVANVPVAADKPGAPVRLHGNRLLMLFTTLATDRDDPWERLRAVSDMASVAKRGIGLIDSEAVVQASELLPPPLSVAAGRVLAPLWRRFPDQLHQGVVVSNVGRPDGPWGFGPYAVDEVCPAGVPAGCTPLTFVFFTYGDQFCVSLCAWPDAVSSARVVGDHARAEVAELLVRARAQAPVAAPRVTARVGH
jgi:diacylglycerol O-acyltransferase